MDYLYSPLGHKSIKPSAVNDLTAGFATGFRENTDINLGVGYVNDKTIPVEAIRKAYDYIMCHPQKYRNALNYGSAEGSPNLRQSVYNYYCSNKLGGLSEDDFRGRKIIIGANGATSLLDAFSDLIQPGIVVTSDPFYYIYTETLQNKGFTILPVEEDSQGIVPEKIAEALANIDISNLSFFYIVTVNNPSTILLSNSRRAEIIEIAARLSTKAGRKIPIIFDKAYEDIIHNTGLEKPVSGLKYDTEGIAFEIGTLSKIIAPALRIGYMICPDNQMAKLLVQRTSDIGFSAPLINQEIASWLIDNFLQQQRDIVNAGYQKKATFIKNLINGHLKPYIERYSGGDAAFYFYLTLKNIPVGPGSKFFKFLSRTTGNAEIDGLPEKKPRLVYIPGTICSKGPNAGCQLRLSYGFEEEAVFRKVFSLLAEACKYALE
ncbi:MAG: aminotransferase class I/II-fold pyridoxal phosphate-dependent enzyme [Bacteroidales bacterium]|nr:aminotransferase class I/II-fold pyridoxal phosphate-dependent enzyme [Bacteroidales bacterium]